MNDTEFAGLLEAAGSTTPVRADTLDRLVQSSRADRPRRRTRAPLVVGVALAGSLLLAAAATSDEWKHIPPFVSLVDGEYRTQTAIPVDFTTTSGLPVRCETFLAYQGLSVQQSQAADGYVAHHDWSGLGQRLYDAGAPADESFEHAQGRIYRALDPVLNAAAAAAVPGALPLSASATSGPRVSSISTICRRAGVSW